MISEAVEDIFNGMDHGFSEQGELVMALYAIQDFVLIIDRSHSNHI